MDFREEVAEAIEAAPLSCSAPLEIEIPSALIASVPVCFLPVGLTVVRVMADVKGCAEITGI